jgi:tetratricopeptide (TPR) repeat protein
MTVCECGQVIHLNGSRRSENNSRAIFLLVLLSFFILGGFVHAVNWDKYSLTIIPLKTKQILGVAKLEDLKEVARICKIRKKYFCQERALISAQKLDRTDRKLLLDIGQLQIDREAYKEAVRTYSSYFTAKGRDKKARLNLAIALSKTGQRVEAKRHLKYLVFSNRRQLQAEAARTYVSLLMETGDMHEAQRVIRFCRGVGNNASLFMEKEWKEVRKRLRSERTS